MNEPTVYEGMALRRIFDMESTLTRQSESLRVLNDFYNQIADYVYYRDDQTARDIHLFITSGQPLGGAKNNESVQN